MVRAIESSDKHPVVGWSAITDVVSKILPSSHSTRNEGGRQRTWLG